MESKFRQTVLHFMSRSGWSWYKLSKAVEYSNANKLKVYFTDGKGTISLTTASRVAYEIERYENSI